MWRRLQHWQISGVHKKPLQSSTPIYSDHLSIKKSGFRLQILSNAIRVTLCWAFNEIPKTGCRARCVNLAIFYVWFWSIQMYSWMGENGFRYSVSNGFGKRALYICRSVPSVVHLCDLVCIVSSACSLMVQHLSFVLFPLAAGNQLSEVFKLFPILLQYFRFCNRPLVAYTGQAKCWLS